MPLLFVGEVRAEAPPNRPNIVLILADDLGFSDLGCYGSEIETPALDRLAAGGLRFNQFYNTGRCWPTRASLMTGLYPHQSRMAMNFGEQAPPAYSGFVPPAARMIPELLAPRGYRSYHVGKWHLNSKGPKPNDTWPLGRGFARSYALMDHDRYFSPKSHYEGNDALPSPADDFYVTDFMSDHAAKYLQQHAAAHADQPFFLYLAYTAPHFPLHARADDVARFRGKFRNGWDKLRAARHRRLQEQGLINCELSPRDPDAKEWASLSAAEQDEWDARMATYAAMIHALDRGVGQVVKQLEAMKVLDNTLILFLSDNGSSAEYLVRGDGHDPQAPPGSRATFRCLEVGWSNVANTPFRMHKMWAHEGGISTPLIAHWPARIKTRGTITPHIGHVIDILPTVLDITGASYPDTFDGQPITQPAGKSFAALFDGHDPPPCDFLFWEHIGNKALRQGDWKLVAEFRGEWELYNLQSDRSETKNLAAAQSGRVKQMASEWDAFAQKIGVVDWSTFPQSKAKPSAAYRMK